jgi:hypothetical protein
VLAPRSLARRGCVRTTPLLLKRGATSLMVVGELLVREANLLASRRDQKTPTNDETYLRVALQSHFNNHCYSSFLVIVI